MSELSRYTWVEMESPLLRDALNSSDDDAIALAMALDMYFDDIGCRSYFSSYTITFGGKDVEIGI